MRPTPAGKYRQRITLLAPSASESLDAYAEPLVNPITVGTFWARVTPLSGHELVSAKQVKAQATFKVSMRYQGSSVIVSPLHQFSMNGRTFGIFDVKNVEERDRRYEFTAFEIQTGGLV